MEAHTVKGRKVYNGNGDHVANIIGERHVHPRYGAQGGYAILRVGAPRESALNCGEHFPYAYFADAVKFARLGQF